MAFLDLGLSPAREETSECSLPNNRDSPAPEFSSEHITLPALGVKRRKAAHADVLPRAGNDSFHWLKYGEKLLRDRQTLRHYYRCALRVETGCSAKKMVDVLVPSGECNWHYREVHNHPTPAGTASGREPRPASGHPYTPPANFDLLSQGAAQGILPLLAANQNSSMGDSSSALAAMLLGAQTGADLASRFGGSPLMPLSSSTALALPAIPGIQPGNLSAKSEAAQMLKASSHSPLPPSHAFLSSPASGSPSPILPKQQQQHQHQQQQHCLPFGLEALLSGESPQASSGSLGLPGLPAASPPEGRSTQTQVISFNATGSHSSASLSDLSRMGDGRRLKKGNGASRLSKLGANVLAAPQSLARKRSRGESDLFCEQNIRVGTGLCAPALQEASVDHVEPELSQGSSCVKPEAADFKMERASLTAVGCCKDSACSWLSLGHGSLRCRCYLSDA